MNNIITGIYYFRELEISIEGFAFRIRFIASPIISIFLSMARLHHNVWEKSSKHF